MFTRDFREKKTNKKQFKTKQNKTRTALRHTPRQEESSRKSCASLKTDCNREKFVALFTRSCIEEAEVRNVMKPTLKKRKDHSRHDS